MSRFERFRERDVEPIVSRIRNVIAEWADKQEAIETLTSSLSPKNDSQKEA